MTLSSQLYVLLSVTSFRLSVLKNTLRGVCQTELIAHTTNIKELKYYFAFLTSHDLDVEEVLSKLLLISIKTIGLLRYRLQQ